MSSTKENSGMQNMRSRINELGGDMRIERVPNTQLQFIMPVDIG